jgi:hypothetical protein
MNQKSYNGWILSGLVCCYIAFWSFIIAAANLPAGRTSNIIGSIGEGLLWGTLISVLIVDFKGYVTLKGLVNWRNQNATKGLGMVIVLTVLFPLTLAFYLIRAIIVHIRHRQQPQLGYVNAHTMRIKPFLAIVCGTLATILVFVFYANVVHGTNTTTVVQTDATTKVSPATSNSNLSQPLLLLHLHRAQV